MIKVLVALHLSDAFLLRFIFSTRTSTGSFPNPKPAKECNVIPPTLQAARPVDAVTAMTSGWFALMLFKVAMISLNKTDFPVP